MHLDRNNGRFTDIRRKYGNQVQIDIGQPLGGAVLYSLDLRRSAVEIAREFELVEIDDYFKDSRMKLKNSCEFDKRRQKLQN